MAYEKQTFVDWKYDAEGNVVTAGTTLGKAHLDHMEAGIEKASADIDNLNNLMQPTAKTKSGKIVTVATTEGTNLSVELKKEGITDYSNVAVHVIGANLLKFPYWYMYNNWGQQGVFYTADTATGKIHVTGTAEVGGGIKLWRSADNFTLPGGVYCVSWESSNATLNVFVNAYVDGKVVAQSGDRGGVLDVSAYDAVDLEVFVNVTAGQTYDDDIYPMIHVGNTMIPWEPYKTSVGTNVNEDGKVDVSAISPYTTVYAQDWGYTTHISWTESSIDTMLKEFEEKLANLNAWNGKKWCVCGDSITAPYEGTQRYYDLAHKQYGIEIVTEAVGGSGFFAAGVNALVNRIENVPDDSDVITILCGINDVAAIASGILQVGDTTDAAENTFCGCVNSTLNKLFKKNVQANVGVISPIVTVTGDTYPADVQKSVNAALREICENRSIPFLDLYHGSGMRPDEDAFRALYYNSQDGLHPNTLGHERIYPKILQFLKTLLPM